MKSTVIFCDFQTPECDFMKSPDLSVKKDEKSKEKEEKINLQEAEELISCPNLKMKTSNARIYNTTYYYYIYLLQILI
jgi:hypothetical protein